MRSPTILGKHSRRSFASSADAGESGFDIDEPVTAEGDDPEIFRECRRP